MNQRFKIVPTGRGDWRKFQIYERGMLWGWRPSYCSEIPGEGGFPVYCRTWEEAEKEIARRRWTPIQGDPIAIALFVLFVALAFVICLGLP